MKPIILQGHSRPIKHLHISNETNKLYSASNDRSILVWDMETKEKIKAYSHSAAINSFGISNCNKFLFSGDNTGNLYVWFLTLGLNSLIIEGDPTQAVKSVHVSSNDSFLLVLFSERKKNGKSYVKNFRLCEILNRIDTQLAPQQPVSQANQEKSDGQGSSQAKTTKAPENNGGKKTNNYQNNSSIYSEAYNSDSLGKHNKKNSNDVNNFDKFNLLFHTPKKLDIETIPCEHILECKVSKYSKAQFTNGDKNIIVSREDGYIELVNLQTKSIVFEGKFHDDEILDFDQNTDLNILLTSSKDGFASVIDLKEFKVLFKFHPTEPTRNLNTCCLMTIDNPFLSLEDEQEKNILIDVDNLFEEGIGSLDDKFKHLRKEQKLHLAVFSGGQDSKLVTTTHTKEGGFEVIAHDLVKGSRVLNLEAHFGPVNAICCSKDGILASGAEDSTVKVYSICDYLKSQDTWKLQK